MLVRRSCARCRAGLWEEEEEVRLDCMTRAEAPTAADRPSPAVMAGQERGVVVSLMVRGEVSPTVRPNPAPDSVIRALKLLLRVSSQAGSEERN